MCQHYNHSYYDLVPLNRKMGWAPLGWVIFAPTGILPLITPTSTLVTPGVSLVVILVTLVTLVMVSSVTRPMVILSLLVVIHQEGWGTSGVVPLTVFITG